MGRITTSKWRPWRPLLPTSHTELPIDAARESLLSVVSAAVIGFVLQGGLKAPAIPGWNYTNSFTLGEGTPGTAAAPIREYMKYGSGITTKIVRRANTYDGAGNITKVVLTYSEDNGNTYANLTDENGNFVLNLTYNGANNLTSTTWAKA